ncbi:ATP-binding protein [Amycolatopsis sp. NPDC058986]|uniref:ATP-binding protein n=1 Tax=unclassified Amycolatopsis TaxID=2618356 RepID=UPI00366E9374
MSEADCADDRTPVHVGQELLLVADVPRFRCSPGGGGDTLNVVAGDEQRVRNQNQASGEIRGAVVQAGVIHDVWLSEAAAHRDAAGGGLPVVPRQLPPVVQDFTGRSEHVTALDALLPSDRDDMARDTAPSPHTAVITAIDGTAGIGKTTLAVWWAHRVQHEFPDGTLYVNLRGYGPGDPATTTEVLDGFLRALGVPSERMPVGVEARAGLFRSLLAERRVLIVLDNAHHADQVRPLLPGTPGCLAVITSRDRLTGLVVTDGARRLTLDLLTEHEAVQLVTGVLGPARAGAEGTAVTELVRWCARLPLALRIAAGRAAAYPHSTVTAVVTELADERVRLDVLSRGADERAAVRAVFGWSYQGLSAEHARVFRRLGLHPGPEVSVHAAAAVADVDPTTARRVLEELAQMHLIEPVGQDRYRFHDLLRAYALDQATRQDDPDDRDHAQRCLLDWYAHTARTCDTLTCPAHERLPQPVTVPAHPTSIPDVAHAVAWLALERHNLLAAVHHAAWHGLHQHTLYLAQPFIRFLSGVGSWETILDIESCGIAAARHSDDGSAEAWFLMARGQTLTSLRRWGDARDHYEQLLARARDLGDRARLAVALVNLGYLSIEQERFEQALPYLGEALALRREVGTVRGKAVAEGGLSRAYAGLGRYQQALRHAENELVLRRRCDDFGGEAYALSNVARAWQGLGEHRKAIALCREAISLARTSGFLAGAVAKGLDTLAVSLHHIGDTTSAIACWNEAAAIFDDRGYPFAADRVRDRTCKATTRS